MALSREEFNAQLEEARKRRRERQGNSNKNTTATALDLIHQDYQNDFDNYKKRYETDGYRGDSNEWLSAVMERHKKYKANRANVLSGLNQANFSEEETAEIQKYIDDIDRFYSGMWDSAVRDKAYYSRWESEDDYNQYQSDTKDMELSIAEIEQMEEDYRLWSAADLNSDYAQNPEWQEAYASGTLESVSENKRNAIAQKKNEYNKKYGEKYGSYGEYEFYRDAQQLEAEAREDAEFGEIAKKSADISNPTIKEAQGWVSVFGNPVFGEEIGNIVTYSRDNWQELATGDENVRTLVGNWKYKYMTDDEVETYNYLLATNKNRADDYLKYIDDVVEVRYGEEVGNNMANAPYYLKLIASFGSGVAISGEGIRNLFSEGEYKPPSANQIINSAISNSEEGIAKIALDASSAVGGMLPSIATSTMTGMPITGAAMMGLSAGGNAYQEKINAGWTDSEATAYAFLTGASETMLEYALGGISKLGGKLTNQALSKLSSSMTKAIGRFAFKYGGSVVSEFGEEFMQEVLNPYFEDLARGNNLLKTYKRVNLEDAFYNGMIGAITAGMLEFVPAVSNEYGTYLKGKEIKESGAAGKLVDLGKTFSDGSSARKIANRTNDNSGAYAIGRLFEEVGINLSNQNLSDIQTALEESGVSHKDAKAIAEWCNNALENGTFDVDPKLSYKNDPLQKLLKDARLESDSSNVRNRNSSYEEILTLIENNGETNSAEELSEDEMVRRFALAMGEPEFAIKFKHDLNEAKKSIAKDVSVSSDGKTIRKSNDQEAAIKGIVSDNGTLKIKLDNGEKVSASDLEYPSHDVGVVYSTILDMDVSASVAESLINGFDSKSGMRGDVYALGVKEAYDYGLYNVAYDDVSVKGFAIDLTESQRKLAYDLGKMEANKVVDAKQKALDAAKNEAKKNKTIKAKQGKVIMEGGAKAHTPIQKQSLNALRALADLSPIEIHVFESKKGSDRNYRFTKPNGTVTTANGWYVSGTNEIWVDLNSGNAGEGTMVYTIAHEISHYIKDWSSTKWKAMADVLMEEYHKNGVDVERLIQRQLLKVKKKYNVKNMPSQTKLREEAYEEVVCEAMCVMLTDGTIAEKLAEIKQKDKSLRQKIGEAIKKFLENWGVVYAEYKDRTPDAEEAQILESIEGAVKKLQDLYAEAFADANETYSAVGTLNTNAVRVTADGTIMLQQRHYEETGRDTLYDYLSNQYGTEDADQLIETIDNINSVMDEIKRENPNLKIFSEWQSSEILVDDNGKPIFTTSINNGDYKLNQDFSRVCKKRRQLDFVLNLLAEDPEFSASYLTKKDFVAINNAIKKHGFEIACALCFVDSKRFRQAEWADSFANTWNDILESVMVEGGKPTPFNFATNNPNMADEGIQIDVNKSVSYRKWSDGKATETRTYKSLNDLIENDGNANVKTIARLILENPNLRHTFRGADIIASKGFDSMQKLAPDVRNILDGWGGSSVPKPSSSDASYDSSILNIDGYNEEAAYAMGGARMNSFSDFMAHMFFDYCEAFADLSAKKLPMQSYTKELVFARLFGKLGGKINMSGIAAIRENTLPLVESKKNGITKAQAEANAEIEKRFAGLDVSRLTEHLQKDVTELTEDDLEQFLDMCDYLWADESIDMVKATLLQSGILYDRLSESKQAECYELLKEGKFDEAFKGAGKNNVDTEYAKHIGTIVVGVSDAHIRKLLRDPTIRMVIPYHKSGLNPTIAKLLKISVYKDYTDVQNTGILKKGAKKRVNLSEKTIKSSLGLKDFDFYQFFGKTIDGVTYDGRAVADKYLDWCENGFYDEEVGDYVYYTTKKQGYILAKDLHKQYKIVPKFDAFKGEINYYKVLEDFDCYNTITGEHSPQGAVEFLQKGLPEDYKQVLVEALKEEQSVQDAFRDHLDNYGLRDEIMSIVKKNGYDATEGIGIGKSVTNDIKNSIRDDIVDVDGNEYEGVVELDKHISKSVLSNPKRFMNYIKNNLIGLRIPVLDDQENLEIIEFAQEKETVKKGKSKHPVLGELAYMKGDIRKQVVANAEEVIKVSVYDPVFSSTDNEHGWLDKNGWESRKAYVLAGDGMLYEAYLKIAKAQDGRNILYTINVDVKKGITVDQDATSQKAAVLAVMPSDKKDTTYSYKSQERNSDFSNRTILANALDGATQNPYERQKLKEYKSKINSIEAEEKKLQEVNARLKDLYFGRGKRDTAKIKELKAMKTRISNRIGIYDKQLLRLEASKPLMDVLRREKDLVRKSEKEKASKAMRDYKERVAKRDAATREYYQESRKKAVEKRNRTALRGKIKKVVGDLNHIFIHGTKERNVKFGLEETVRNALIAADKIFAEEGGENIAKCLDALYDAYANLRLSKDDLAKSVYNEYVETRLMALRNSVGDTPFSELNEVRLLEIYDAYKMVKHMVSAANKLFRSGKAETLQETASAVTKEIRAIAKKHRDRIAVISGAMDHVNEFSYQNQKPVYVFDRIGSKTFSELYWDAVEAEGVYARDIEDAGDFLARQREQYHYENWDLKATYTFKLENGELFRLNIPQMMSIYAYSKREQAYDHMTKGGFMFDKYETYYKYKEDENGEYVKDKKGNPIKYPFARMQNSSKRYAISSDIIKQIIDTLSADQKAYAEKMQEYLSAVMGDKGNSVSRELYGINLFKETFYFPLKSQSDFLNSVTEALQKTQTQASLKNTGMAKETVPHANNPIILQSFDDVWLAHVDKMSQYHALVLPIENLQKVFNYKVVSTDGTEQVSVKNTLSDVLGSEATRYIKEYIEDLNGGVQSGGYNSPFASFFGKFKKAAVAASLSTAIQQPTAVIRAMAMIRPDYFVPFLRAKKTVNVADLYDEMKRYAPIAIIKEMGGFDTGSSRQAKDYIGVTKYHGFKSKAKGFAKDKAYRNSVMDNTFMGLATAADKIGWVHIWSAVKKEVAATSNHKVGSDEYFKECGKRFTEVIVYTQVYDSVNSRSGLMRSDRDINKFATSFMGEPTTAINMVFDAFLQVQRAPKGKKAQAVGRLARVLSSWIVSSIAASAMASIIYAFRDDDEDEALLEKWAEKFVSKATADIFVANMIPYVRDLVSIWQGWNVERPDMSIFADIKTAYNKLSKDDVSAYVKIEEFGGSIAAAFGLPLKNMMKDARGIYNAVHGIFDDAEPTDMRSAFVRGLNGDKLTKSQNIYNAVMDDNKTVLAAIRSNYDTEKKYQAAVRKALKENDPRIKEAAQARNSGDMSEYKRITRQIASEGNFTLDDAIWAINSAYNELQPEKEDTGESAPQTLYKTADYFKAIETNQLEDAALVKEEMIESDISQGKTKNEALSSFNTKVRSYIRERYKEGAYTDVEARRALARYGGMSVNDAIIRVREWKKAAD